MLSVFVFFVVYRRIPSKPLASVRLFDLTDMFSVYVGSFPGVQAKPTSQMWCVLSLICLGVDVMLDYDLCCPKWLSSQTQYVNVSFGAVSGYLEYLNLCAFSVSGISSRRVTEGCLVWCLFSFFCKIRPCRFFTAMLNRKHILDS